MLTSGKTYNLAQLFSGAYSIIIPDMQREYCWPSVVSNINNKNLVQNFVSDLIKSDRNQTVQLGLLYAYESPKNDLQLCDGQQRITTIYLLLGNLYNRVEKPESKEAIKQFLVRETVYNRNRLKYAIRETTLHFLNDLVENYFLNGELLNKQNTTMFIKQQEWYFNEYDLDPSIQNILLALQDFEAFKEQLDDDFAYFLLNKIEFLFFDMLNRSYGEEQFVVLNTTGEPLTKTENLKPQFLGDLNQDNKKFENNTKTELVHYADLWEAWETFFWQNKFQSQDKKRQSHKTADKGFNEFLRWIYILEKIDVNDSVESDKQKYSKAQRAIGEETFNIFDLNEKENKTKILDIINEYFKTLQTLSNDKELRRRFLFQEKPLAQIALFEWLPVLYFAKHFKLDLENKHFQNLQQFLKSRAKDSNVSKASITTSIRAIQIVKKMVVNNQQDIAQYHIYQDVASGTILDHIAKFKFDILSNSDNRGAVQSAFAKAENLKTTQGNISFMLLSQQNLMNVMELQENDFDLEAFTNLIDIVENSFENHSNLMRRALLTFGFYDTWHGNTTSLSSHRYTLGGSPQYYGEIANDFDKEVYKTILTYLQAVQKLEPFSKEMLSEWMESKISQYECANEDIYNIVRCKLIKDIELLNTMENNFYCVSYDKTKAYILCKQKVTRNDSYKQII